MGESTFRCSVVKNDSDGFTVCIKTPDFKDMEVIRTWLDEYGELGIVLKPIEVVE